MVGAGGWRGGCPDPILQRREGPPDPSRGFFPPWGPSPGDLLALQEEVKETWRPSPRWMEARGDTQRCWMLATLPQGAGGSGGGRSLKPLLQRLPACLSEHQRGGKGEKRPAGRLEVSRHRKQPSEILFPGIHALGELFSGCPPKRPPSSPFGPGAHAPAASGPLGAVPGVKKKHGAR